MKPLSPDALKRMAFAHGAKLEIGGASMNVARMKVQTPVKPKAPPVVAAPEPVAQPVNDPAVGEALQAISRCVEGQEAINHTNQSLIAALRVMLEDVARKPQTEPRPTQWVFTVKRNSDGFIDAITANVK